MVLQHVIAAAKFALSLAKTTLLLVLDLLQWLMDTRFLYRLQLFEWCDLWITPSVIKHHCQKTLTAQWMKRLPFLQSQPPVYHASNLIRQVLGNITDIDAEPYTIVDFCSGWGGPTPSIERAVNGQRIRAGLQPISFRLTDLHPDIDAWLDISSHSEYLSFVPQPVDARCPPAGTISVSARETMPVPLVDEYSEQDVSVMGTVTIDPAKQALRDADRKAMKKEMTADTKMIHLYCLSFHHFGADMAKEIITNTLQYSDAFVIIELQERKIGTIAMMVFEPLLLLLVSWYWFWGDWTQLFLTYIVPVLPLVHGWDGLVSCLRTRTFKEMRDLIDGVIADDRIETERTIVMNGQPRGSSAGRDLSKWTISEARVLHTWPCGWLNATVGIRSDTRRDNQ